MKQENTDNRQTAEAQQLREKSAFINQVTSFAEYMQKEFIEPSDGDMGLIICAADHTTYDKDNGKQTGACHVALGGRAVTVASLASMMQQDEMQDLFRKARIMSSTDGSNGYMTDELRRLRSRLNRDYAFLVLPIGYSLLLAVLTVLSPAFHLSTTIASVFLMAFLTMLIVRDILDRRRQIARIRAERHSEDKKRAEAAAKTFFDMLRRRMNDDDDE